MPTETIALHPNIQALLKKSPLKNYFGGKWVEGKKAFKTYNPATGEAIAEVFEASAQDVDAAVQAARAAFDSGAWSQLNPAERGKILWRAADLLEKNKDELAQLESLNNGKPVREAKHGDLNLTIDGFRYFAGYANKDFGRTFPADLPYAPKAKFFTYTVHEPVGVVAAIVPWNFPLQMAAQKLAPALATGNVVLLKPAEQTPLSALRLVEILEEAGLPPGTLSVLNGGPETGKALVDHPGVDKISFTGSTDVGREIVKRSAGNLKRVSLELGGKSPHIIFADADLEAAAKAAYMGIFYNQGQCCCAGSRIFVERPVFEALAQQMVARAGKAKLGPGLDPDTQMGALVSTEHMDRVLSYIDAGKKEGAKLLAGGERAGGPLANGWFVKPTVFVDVKDEMKIAREEIFGPVAALLPFDKPEEALARANASAYGLAAGIWTKDIKKAFRLAHSVKAGTVWINAYNLSDMGAPWGGYKESGWGREMGEEALRLFTETKCVWVDLN